MHITLPVYCVSLHEKNFFYNNIICFCLETQEMYQKLNIISY